MQKRSGTRFFGSVRAIDGTLLANLRTTLKASQPEFAHRVGVSTATVSRAEQGMKVSKSSAQAMADALGRPLESLFVNEGSIGKHFKLNPEANDIVLSQNVAGPSVAEDTGTLTDELAFISIADGQPSLRLGALDLQCKLFPANVWNQSPVQTYTDDPEAKFRVELVSVPNVLPADLLSTLVAELAAILSNPPSGASIQRSARELDELRETYKRLQDERSNAYPRLAGMPETYREGGESVLRIPIAPSKYGVALIRERHLTLPTAQTLVLRHILNSLAVRVLYIFRDRDGREWGELQQRQFRENATFAGAWDVSAAGYIDPFRHEDPRVPGQISPSRACASELEEELRIPLAELPYRDNYYFFGVGRNDTTGQLDILGYCLGDFVPEPARKTSPLVSRYDRCRLDPESVAQCLVEKGRWVPTALLTLVLALEARGKYPRQEIEDSLQSCVGRLNLQP
jgi:transcriptional regulator with XRE-family HTH domain